MSFAVMKILVRQPLHMGTRGLDEMNFYCGSGHFMQFPTKGFFNDLRPQNGGVLAKISFLYTSDHFM